MDIAEKIYKFRILENMESLTVEQTREAIERFEAAIDALDDVSPYVAIELAELYTGLQRLKAQRQILQRALRALCD